jgi:hypothetical protein
LRNASYGNETQANKSGSTADIQFLGNIIADLHMYIHTTFQFV